MLKKLFVLMLLGFSSISYGEAVSIQITKIDSWLARCLKASTVEESTRTCYFKAYEGANKLLDAVILSERMSMSKQEIEWKKAGSQMNAPEAAQAALVLSQEGWIKYREGHCELLSTDSYGGSNATNIRNECLYKMTKQRLIEVAAKFKY